MKATRIPQPEAQMIAVLEAERIPTGAEKSRRVALRLAGKVMSTSTWRVKIY